MINYEESILRLGRLQSVLTKPRDQPSANRVRHAVIFLNAGLIPRSGPFRLHTLLSRQLAQNGVWAARVDLAGIGDSDQVTNTRGIQQTVVEDVQQVIAQLQSIYAIQRFIIFGVCTGADFAHCIAMQEKNVIGLCAIDGYLYPTWRSRWCQLAPLLKNPPRLFAAVQRFLTGNKTTVVDGGSDFSWQLPPQAQARQQYAQLSYRQLRALMIFTGGYFEYRYEGQFRDGIVELRNDPNFIEKYFPLSDHLFSIKSDQQALIDCVLQWVENNVASANQQPTT